MAVVVVTVIEVVMVDVVVGVVVVVSPQVTSRSPQRLSTIPQNTFLPHSAPPKKTSLQSNIFNSEIFYEQTSSTRITANENTHFDLILFPLLP